MDILIVSGFLGAGKTTFIKALSKRTGKEFAILENEYSDTGVDGDRLKDNALNIWELTEGCICCSTKQDFAQSVLTIANTVAPDYLVVEPTGVAKLSNIILNLKKIEYEKIKLLSPLCILDAGGIVSYGSEFPDIFKDQILNASKVILSKTENLSVKEREALIKEVHSIAPGAKVTEQHYTQYPDSWWDDILSTYLDGSVKPKEIAGESVSPDTFSLSDASVSSIGGLVCFMEDIVRGEYGNIIRAKGNVGYNKGCINFDVAGGRYALLLSQEVKDSNAVFIGNRIRRQKIREVLFRNSKKIKIISSRK